MKTVTLGDLLGRWTLSREIRQADGGRARFEGVAQWTLRDDGAADYVETGALILPEGRFTAERRYRWAPDLRVFFDDGRFFHAVPPEGGDAGHWCDPDQYDLTYDFAEWPRWQVECRVAGPRKSYVMTSLYSPE